MANVAIDTLKLAEKLASVGFDEQKSRVLAEQFSELASEHLVTREYLDYKLSELRQELRGEMKDMQYKITLSLGGWIVAVLTFFELVNRFLAS